MLAPCDEPQVNRNQDSAIDSIRHGFMQWMQMDWKVFEDLAAPAPHGCQTMEMSFPHTTWSGAAKHGRRVLLGPVVHRTAEQATAPHDEEHLFCPCCLFTNMEAFMPLMKDAGKFGLRLYAARNAFGEVMVECRVNSED